MVFGVWGFGRALGFWGRGPSLGLGSLGFGFKVLGFR